MENKSKFLRISHYNLLFNIHINKGSFNVEGTLKLQNDQNHDYDNIPILLYHQLKVKSIRDIKNKELNFTQHSMLLEDRDNYYVNYISVDLNENLKQGENTELYIEYEGTLNGYTETGMLYVKDKINKDFSIIREDCRAYPIIAEPNSVSMRKSMYNNFTYELFINLPKDYAAGCGGILKEIIREGNRDIYNYECFSPTNRFDIGIAKYSIVEDVDMNLKIFAFSKDKDTAENVVKYEIKRVYDFYTKVFGKYKDEPYYTVIEIKEGYGQQNGKNYITLGESAFAPDRKRFSGLYHEIGHIWNVKKPKLKVHRTRFFDEAFATYFDALAIREFHGENEYREKMELYRKYFVKSIERDNINYDTPICDYWKHEIGGNSYTKGPWVLYILHEIVGNETFYEIIRELLNKFKDKEIEFNDFEELAENVSGVNFNKFFKEWIYGVESSKYLYDGFDIKKIIENSL